MGRTPPVEPDSVDMARHFWYVDAGKAARELGFDHVIPAHTLRDTVNYIREHLLGTAAFIRASAAVG